MTIAATSRPKTGILVPGTRFEAHLERNFAESRDFMYGIPRMIFISNTVL